MRAELEGRRSEAATDVQPTVLAEFDRIAGRHSGEGLAPIEPSEGRKGEYSCGGCYMKLSVEHYNALLSRDEIRHCDSCGRILYVDVDGGSSS